MDSKALWLRRPEQRAHSALALAQSLFSRAPPPTPNSTTSVHSVRLLSRSLGPRATVAPTIWFRLGQSRPSNSLFIVRARTDTWYCTVRAEKKAGEARRKDYSSKVKSSAVQGKIRKEQKTPQFGSSPCLACTTTRAR